jgi:hypothetical protein
MSAALTSLLLGIVIGGMLVLLADTGSEKTSTSQPSYQQAQPGEIPPIGKEPSA